VNGRLCETGLSSLVDGALELSVVGSFTRIGPAVRRRLCDWADPEPDALAGRTALVTGPTSGLGRAVAAELAALGARVVLLGRNEARLASVRAELAAGDGEERFPIVVADMASLRSVRAAIAGIEASEPRLDIVVDNAGAVFADRTESDDGIEATLATMVVGPFLLEAGLLPLLERTPGSRVIAVTSGGMYLEALELDDLGYRRGAYSGLRAYARAKRAQVALMREWARRLDGRVAFMAMHPGWADTPGLAEAMPGFHGLLGRLLRSPTEGADTVTWLATRDTAAPLNGGLYLDRRRRPFDRVPWTRLDRADRRRLWTEVVRLAGVDDPLPAASSAAAAHRRGDDRGGVDDRGR
jgi:dehydrogenase/reductase SDR family member 12